MKNYHKIFIEHTPYCRSIKCDTPCEAQEMPIRSPMSPETILNILTLISTRSLLISSGGRIVLYGQGSSRYKYDNINIPLNYPLHIETTVCEDYELYFNMLHKTPIKKYARVYSPQDVRVAIEYNYDGLYFVVAHREYGHYAKMMDLGGELISPIPLNESNNYNTYKRLVKEFKIKTLDRVNHHREKIMVVTGLVMHDNQKTILCRENFNPGISNVFH